LAWASSLAGRLALGEQRLDEEDELVRVDGFRLEDPGPPTPGLFLEVGKPRARDDDRQGRRELAAHVRDQLESVHVRHHDVGHDDIGAPFPDDLEGGAAGGSGTDLVRRAP
jgi:hypothetical protein